MESWEKISAVQRMQDYIDAHMTDAISLHMLARAAGYSRGTLQEFLMN
jgi:AraC-like DNA-binding protein